MEGAGRESVSVKATECDSDSAMTSRTVSCFNKLLKVCTAWCMRVNKLRRFLVGNYFTSRCVPECPSERVSV